MTRKGLFITHSKTADSKKKFKISNKKTVTHRRKPTLASTETQAANHEIIHPKLSE